MKAWAHSTIDLCFLMSEVDSDDVLFRRNYLMLQYVDTKVWRDLNLSVRMIHDIDDSSNRAIGTFEYEVGDHAQMYLIANVRAIRIGFYFLYA